jgi:hypothetical protein
LLAGYDDAGVVPVGGHLLRMDSAKIAHVESV